MTESSSSSSTSWREASLLSRIRTLLPVGFEAELKNLSLLAVPAILTHFMVLSASFVSTMFCGHLGRVELDAVSLAIAVVNVTGISVGAGLSSACDTLISQTYGAGNLLRVGVIVQRTILILILTCFPCWAVLINTESILLVLGQEPEVARLSQLYVKIFMPALPATFMYQLQAGYLQNQGIIWPQVITGFVANLLNAFMNYIVLFVLNMGVAGSALANIVSQFSMAGILYTYILWKGLHKVTWGGWSKDCLQEWGSFIHLAIPSMLMLCVEWWTFEITIFLAGLISEVELGAQSVIYQISNCVYMFPFGFSQAGTVRVGNALGAGDAQRAKLSAKLSMFCAVLVSLCLMVIIGSLRHHIAYIFTYDEYLQCPANGQQFCSLSGGFHNIIYGPKRLDFRIWVSAISSTASCLQGYYGTLTKAVGSTSNVTGVTDAICRPLGPQQIRLKVAEVAIFYAPFILMEAILVVAEGIIIGMGKQKVGAVCNILSYSGVCLPVGVLLMFKTKLGIKGLWTGLCASASLQSCVLLVYLAKMNWEKVTLEAQIRAGVTRSSEDPQHQSDMYELLVPEEWEEEWEEEDEEEEEEEAATVVAVSAPDQYLARGP
ncbi:multidrug and toxin extrusion protein 2 isoform X3 [Phyllopteryx taeniolatus]|uniref:multidrug and toxin extrusion protein 2 isoform X3 n=1 Tax=Phyllopteryx taeniolatus TaxID=161469 RepID=UPI002AD55DA0|nr:multidrug and toxin extrusion protein 2 isoform X3 [Phyllopteryx taeniolatus]